MAAKLGTISSSLTTKLPKLSSTSSSHTIIFCSPGPTLKPDHFKINAKLGGGEELKPDDKKKFITKEQEPEQYWQTAGEREGENPMKTPLPYIIIFGMSIPFIILAVAFANGWIKVPVRLYHLQWQQSLSRRTAKETPFSINTFQLIRLLIASSEFLYVMLSANPLHIDYEYLHRLSSYM